MEKLWTNSMMILLVTVLSGVIKPWQALAIAEDPVLRAGSAIANFRVVDLGKIYRGGNPYLYHADGLQSLAALGVKTDIDLQGADLDLSPSGLFASMTELGERPENISAEKAAVLTFGMEFQNLPLNSHANISPAEAAEIEEALKLMADPAQQPIYIHCEHGVDRTGLLVALYRVRFQGWGPARAYQEWLTDGHGAALNQFFTNGLDGYFKTATGWNGSAD